MILSAVTLVGPAFKVVFIANAFDVGIQLIGTSKDAGLIGMHNIRLPASGDFALTVANHYHGRVACLIHIDSINARPRGVESQVWCIDLKNFATLQAADANPQRSFSELQLGGSVIEVQ